MLTRSVPGEVSPGSLDTAQKLGYGYGIDQMVTISTAYGEPALPLCNKKSFLFSPFLGRPACNTQPFSSPVENITAAAVTSCPCSVCLQSAHPTSSPSGCSPPVKFTTGLTGVALFDFQVGNNPIGFRCLGTLFFAY